MRWVIACAMGLSVTASADRFEASGFVGIAYFGDNIALGNSWAPDQIPGTSPLLGARVTYLAAPGLWTRHALALDLAGEGELAVAPAFTAGNFDGGRMSYFAPVFELHAHAALRLRGLPYLTPHLVIGGGSETVASSSPFMAKETDPVFYWGPGASAPLGGGWTVRLDVRHGVMPARVGSVTSTLAVQLGLSTSFGLPATPAHHAIEHVTPPPIVDEADSDGDGLPDHVDRCPDQPETVNGIDDGDGCPESDPDGDGLLGAADRCPDQAEDFDHFQDDDGCPEPDNDGDGIADAHDACPDQPETTNGFDDGDGCPDALPPELVTALAARIEFAGARAKLSDRAKQVLDPLAALLVGHGALKIEILAHPVNDLAKRRAEAVKWYLVGYGVPEDQLAVTTAPGAAGIELRLSVPQK